MTELHPTAPVPNEFEISIPNDVLARYHMLGQNEDNPIADLLQLRPYGDCYTCDHRPQVNFALPAQRLASDRACGLIHVVAALLQPQLACLNETPLLVKLLKNEEDLRTYPAFAKLVHATMVLEGHRISRNSLIVRLVRDNSPVLFNVLDQGVELYRSGLALATTYGHTAGMNAVLHTPLRSVKTHPAPQPFNYATLTMADDEAAAGHAAPYSLREKIKGANAWVTPTDMYYLLSQVWRYNYTIHDPVALALLVEYKLVELMFPLCYFSELHHEYIHQFAKHIPLLDPSNIVHDVNPFFTAA
jgi:hypothetical protein